MRLECTRCGSANIMKSSTLLHSVPCYNVLTNFELQSNNSDYVIKWFAYGLCLEFKVIWIPFLRHQNPALRNWDHILCPNLQIPIPKVLWTAQNKRKLSTTLQQNKRGSTQWCNWIFDGTKGAPYLFLGKYKYCIFRLNTKIKNSFNLWPTLIEEWPCEEFVACWRMKNHRLPLC